MRRDLLARARMILLLALLCLAAMPAASHAAEVIVGVTTNSQMVRFDSSSPGTMVARIPISGLFAGEQLAAIDQRPASGEILALSSLNRVLRLNPQDGTVTALGATGGTFAATAFAGVDFNPAADRLRMVNAANDNGRYNPVTQTYVQDDTDVAYIATDVNVGVDPNVVAAAYDRNDTNGATATTLFGIDSTVNNLVRQGAIDGNASDGAGGGSPNGGLLTTLGPLGFDPTSNVAFDIATTLGGNTGYLASQTQGSVGSQLRTINLPGTNPVGATTSLGSIGSADTLSSMTVLQGGAIRIAGPNTLASEASTQVVVRIERAGDTLAPIQLTYATGDRSALAGLDYVATSGFLDFAAGESTKDVVIPLLGDAEFEGAEVFDLNFALSGPGAVLDKTSQPIVIGEDDAPPVAPTGPQGPAGSSVTTAPDRLAPAFLSFANTPKSLAALRKAKRLTVEFVCSERCVVSFSLGLGKTNLGNAVASLADAGVGKATVRLTDPGRAALGKIKKRTASLVLESTAIDPAGNSVKRRTSFSLPRR